MYQVVILTLVYLVATGCATEYPRPDIDSKPHYIVKERDNLHSIAFAFEISVSQLQEANPWLHPANLAAGMRLTIPSTRSTDISAASPQRDRKGAFHAGVDLRASRGTQVYAAAAGEVVFTGRQNGYGRILILDHGDNLQTVYSHNERNLVHEGQYVEQGELIASVGRTGRATGYHLHFEKLPIGDSLSRTWHSERVRWHREREGRHDFCRGCTINCYFEPSFAFPTNRLSLASVPSKIRYGFTKYVRQPLRRL